jgi:hypothetical protein
MSDLIDLSSQLHELAAALADPATATQQLEGAIAAARTMLVNAVVPAGTAPNISLQSPSSDVPRPSAEAVLIAGALAVLDQPAASPPLPVPGPPGPPGEPGPAGPQGPPGFGFDPARLAALEKEVAFLEDLILTSAMYLPI